MATFIPFSVLVWNDMETTLPCLSFGIPTRRGALVRPGSSRLSLSTFWLISDSIKKETHPPQAVGIPTWLDLEDVFFHHQWQDFWISTSHLKFFVYWCSEFQKAFFLDLFGMGPDMQIISDGWKFNKKVTRHHKQKLLASINLLHCFGMMESF